MSAIIYSDEAKRTRDKYVKYSQQIPKLNTNNFLWWEIRNIRAVQQNIKFEKLHHTKFNIAQRVILLLQYFHNRAIDTDTGQVKTWGIKEIKVNSYEYKWKTWTKKSGTLTGSRVISISDLAKMSGGCSSYISKICQSIYSNNVDMLNEVIYIKTLYNIYKKSHFLNYSILKLIKSKFIKHYQNTYVNNYSFNKERLKEQSSDPPITTEYDYLFENGCYWRIDRNDQFAMKELISIDQIPKDKLNSIQR